MSKPCSFSLAVAILTFLVGCQHSPASTNTPIPPAATVTSISPQPLQYQTHSLLQGTVHTLTIPAQSRYRVIPALSESVDTLAGFAQQHRASAALNAGFFDPQNQKSTSYVMVNGQLVADPRKNERLMNNPKLAPYQAQILNRSEFRQYQCAQETHYDIVVHQAGSPAGCRLEGVIGAGPQLLPGITLIQEAFLDSINGRVIRDALGSQQPNARTAVGIKHDGSVVWVMVAQRLNPPGAGFSLEEVAAFMKTLGVERAMNLDGGSSSSLYYNGKTIYGKLDENGQAVQRRVKSALLVVEQ